MSRFLCWLLLGHSWRGPAISLAGPVARRCAYCGAIEHLLLAFLLTVARGIAG